MSEKTVKCKINGMEIEVSKGTTVIQAFQKLKKDIAHYCWHPGLSVAGVCRLCMVEIEGMNKLQIACNTEVQEGMVITNQSDQVKEAVRWGLEFHLINHPLDCPICDQAGECSLQDQYMKFGTYQPAMAEPKVKKRKVVDLGSKIVLDTERCILCSRCVRFTEEVTKTHELGIFNRGDHSEIGIFQDKPLENKYTLNTVDICPVGALTSKDFRFQQRVWYLKTAESICTGCSTGCNVYVDYNEEGPWRVRPRYNPEVNGHWMCDEGRGIYKNILRKNRLSKAKKGQGDQWELLSPLNALEGIAKDLESSSTQAVVLTGQYTIEEYQALKDFFKAASFYHWESDDKRSEDFDGLLLRGDRNPNTAGLKEVFSDIKPIKELELSQQPPEILFIAGPENPEFFSNVEKHTNFFIRSQKVVWMAPGPNAFLPSKSGFWQIPVKTFFEKMGTFQNFQNLKQKISTVQPIVSEALSLVEVTEVLKGKDVKSPVYEPYFKHNQFLSQKEKLW